MCQFTINCDQINDPNRISVKIKLTPPLESYTTRPLALLLLKAGFNRCLFWEVWKAQMAVFGLVKGLQENQFKYGCMVSYSWPNTNYLVMATNANSFKILLDFYWENRRFNTCLYIVICGIS